MFIILQKFPYGTAREHASIYSSYYPDKDMSNFLPKFQQKQKQQIVYLQND